MRTDKPGSGAPQRATPTVVDEETAEKLRDYGHLVELAVTYHDEATRCARADCLLAASVMVGAMLEAVLLVMTMAFETALKGQGLWPTKEKRPPSRWGLEKLIDVALGAGWLEVDDPTGDENAVTRGEIRQVMTFVLNLRNAAAHPGRHARESRANGIVDKEAYDLAYTVARKAFDYTHAFFMRYRPSGTATGSPLPASSS
jgi:hypothetical protein